VYKRQRHALWRAACCAGALGLSLCGRPSTAGCSSCGYLLRWGDGWEVACGKHQKRARWAQRLVQYHFYSFGAGGGICALPRPLCVRRRRRRSTVGGATSLVHCAVNICRINSARPSYGVRCSLAVSGRPRNGFRGEVGHGRGWRGRGGARAGRRRAGGKSGIMLIAWHGKAIPACNARRSA